MSKKKILIVNNNMRIGGVQKALVNLLKCVHDQYDVTLALFHPGGELMKDIPADVKVMPVRSAYRFLGMTRYDVQHRPLLKLVRNGFAAISRLFGRNVAITLMALGQKRLTGYDAAISYLHDAGDKGFYGGCNDFVLRHTDAPLKIGFLHCDYLNCGASTPANGRRYARFTRIAACSEGCKNAFLKALPDLSDRTVVVQNCQDFEAFRSQAEDEPVQFPGDCLNIVTVARLGREKGIPRAMKALAKLGDTKHPYHYYVVGEGVERPIVEGMIQQYALEDKVTLLGEKANPYGYMKAADLLLLPSISEAAPMVIGEAACLGTPILSTLTTSAKDMVEKTGYGWVCENSVDGICETLKNLLEEDELLEKRKNELMNISFDNTLAMEQFAQLLHGAKMNGQEGAQ